MLCASLGEGCVRFPGCLMEPWGSYLHIIWANVCLLAGESIICPDHNLSSTYHRHQLIIANLQKVSAVVQRGFQNIA